MKMTLHTQLKTTSERRSQLAYHLGELVHKSTLNLKLKSGQAGPSGVKRGQAGPGGTKRDQAGPNRAKWGQTVQKKGPNGAKTSKRGQTDPNGAVLFMRGKYHV